MMRSFDLTPSWRHEARRRSGKLRFWCATAGLYCVATVAGVIWVQMLSTVEPDQSDVLTKLNERIDTAQREVVQVEQDLERLRPAMQISQALANRPDWSVLLALLAELRGDSVVLSRCTLDAASNPNLSTAESDTGDPLQQARRAGFELELEGVANSQASVSQFVLDIESTHLFSEVVLVETSRTEVRKRDVVAFQVKCTLSDSVPDEEAAS